MSIKVTTADLFIDDKGQESVNRPFADYLRPKTLEELVGQDHLVGVDGALFKMLQAGNLPSMILWGTPGCGKTTLARILANNSDLHFEQISAVFSGVQDLRKVFDAAKIRKQNGHGTLLFVDEIHRFNKSQQDAFLPVLEDGTIILIGATTENPSFELNAALLSRAQVFVLKRLDDDALELLLIRAEEEKGCKLPLDKEARSTLKAIADGDGRYILTMAEQILNTVTSGTKNNSSQLQKMNVEALLELIQRRAPLYDKGDDAHFNLISCFHKSLRGSDVDGALYWMARMLQGGENPEYILRRMTCVASEDISNADPHALPLVIAAWQAYERLGLPEGELAMAQAVTYLATAPKSNASYLAIKAANIVAKETGSLMPPKHAMNAPTKLMKDYGYSEGYRYDHDTKEGFSGQNYFPEDMARQEFYKPVERGFERDIKKRMEFFAKRRMK